MRYAVIFSALLHVGLISALSVHLSFNKKHVPSPQTVVVDLVKIAPKTNLPKAKAKPHPPKKKKKAVKKKRPAPTRIALPKTTNVKTQDKPNKNQLTVPTKEKKVVKKNTPPTPPRTSTPKTLKNAKIIPEQKPSDVPPPVINLEQRYDDIFETLDSKIAEAETKNRSDEPFDPEQELSADEQKIIEQIVNQQLSEKWNLLRGTIDADQINVTIIIDMKEDCMIKGRNVLSITGTRTERLKETAKMRAENAIDSYERLTGLSDEQCELIKGKTIETTFGSDEEQRSYYGRRETL